MQPLITIRFCEVSSMQGLVSSVFLRLFIQSELFFSDKLFVKVNCSDYDFSSM